jgi:hypothetical protein
MSSRDAAQRDEINARTAKLQSDLWTAVRGPALAQRSAAEAPKPPAAADKAKSSLRGEPAEWAPADSLFYLGILDTADVLRDFKNTSGYAFFSEGAKSGTVNPVNTILTDLRGVIPQIIQYERQAREALSRERREVLHDKVRRAYGTLQSATMMTSEETMDLLSSIRLGVNLGLLDELTIPQVNELFLHTQPAHLQKLMGASLDGEERNSARARYLRTRLRELGSSLN